MFSASHTLEYSYSAWAVAQWAKQLGDTAHYNQLMYLSKGWERLYDPSVNFIRPKKKDGQFVDNFNPMQVWRGFQEGNAWQYTFYVPHDVQGLVGKVGADVFNARLDSIFTVSQKMIFSGGKKSGLLPVCRLYITKEINLVSIFHGCSMKPVVLRLRRNGYGPS